MSSFTQEEGNHSVVCCILHLLQSDTFTSHQCPVKNAESLHGPLVLRHSDVAATDLAKLSGEQFPAARRRIVQLVVDDTGGNLEVLVLGQFLKCKIHK